MRTNQKIQDVNTGEQTQESQQQNDGWHGEDKQETIWHSTQYKIQKEPNTMTKQKF